MSETFVYNEAARLGARLAALSPEAFVSLIQGLCEAVQDRGDGFHGGVNPSNVSLTEDGTVGLGEALGEENRQFSADQVEYLAPEVFWKNERTPQADVYSLGLMMYTWANGGCLPFLFPDPDPSDRAEALRRRMSGEAFEIPQVSETLAAIISKATEYKAADRYASPAALLDAFQIFAEDAEASGAVIAAKIETRQRKRAEQEQMMAGILAAAEAATAPQPILSQTDKTPPVETPRKAKAEPVVSQPELLEEKKKFNFRPLVAVLLIAAILMVAAVAMQFTGQKDPDDSASSPSPTPTMPTVTDTLRPSPDVTEDPDVSPDTSPDVTPTPTPTPTPDETEHNYTLYIEDVSWNQAADRCINQGGDLVVINDEEEFQKVTELADTYGVELVWVGGFRKDGQIQWVNGETSDYYPWADGEPSLQDSDGTPENFLLLWKRNGTWVYNDSRDNPVADYPAAYSGRIAYICETV